MTDLILIDDEPRIDSRLIAKSLGVKHKNTIGLIQKYQDQFEELGLLPFETEKVDFGRPLSYAILNESQAVFLLTLSRNTPKVAQLKLKLTKDFAYFRNQELKRLTQEKRQSRKAAKQAKLEWQKAREQGKLVRTDFADAIKQLADLAESKGSKNSNRYYTIFTRMIYTILFGSGTAPANFRDSLDPASLKRLERFEIMAAAWITEYIHQCDDYHDIYTEVKNKCMALATLTGITHQGRLIIN